MNKLLRLVVVTALVAVCSVPAMATDYTITMAEKPVAGAVVGPYTLQDAMPIGSGSTLDTRMALATTTLYVAWGAGTSAGVVTVETAPVATAGYAGTWAPLATVTWSAVSKTDVVQIIAPIGILRTRISTTVANTATQIVPAANVTLATNVIQTIAPHGWVVGQKLYYHNGGGAGMTYATGVDLSNTAVYVKTRPAADTFTLSLTLGGATLDLDGQGTNAQYFIPNGVTVTAYGLGR